jgi:nicotinic acid mononucleotide adenylyltransferase
VVAFELASPPVSSSEVRERIAQGEPIEGLVPPAVAAAIDEDGLYRG